MTKHSATTLAKRRVYQQNYANRNKEQLAASRAETYELYKSLGVCPRCKKRDARPGKVSCGPCAKKPKA